MCVRVPSRGARTAYSVRVFPTLWVFPLRVAVLRDSGKRPWQVRCDTARAQMSQGVLCVRLCT